MRKMYQMWRKQNSADERKAELELWTRKKRVQKEIEQDENRSRTHTHTDFVWNFDLCLSERQIKTSVKMDRGGVEKGEMVACSSYLQPRVSLIHNAFIL